MLCTRSLHLAIFTLLLISTAAVAEVYVLEFGPTESRSQRAERELRAQSRHLSAIFQADENTISENATAHDGLWGYITSLAPDVVDGPFNVLLKFNNYVVELDKEDLISNNATISAITGGGTLFSLVVVPEPYSVGDINIQLRSKSVTDIAGNINLEASNILLRSSTRSVNELNFLAEARVSERDVDYQPVRLQPREINPNEFGFRVLAPPVSAQ